MVIEIDQPSLLDTVLQYGLFVGAMFQLVCVFAVVLIPHSKKEETAEEESVNMAVQYGNKQHSDHTAARRGKKEKKKHR